MRCGRAKSLKTRACDVPFSFSLFFCVLVCYVATLAIHKHEIPSHPNLCRNLDSTSIDTHPTQRHSNNCHTINGERRDNYRLAITPNKSVIVKTRLHQEIRARTGGQDVGNVWQGYRTASDTYFCMQIWKPDAWRTVLSFALENIPSISRVLQVSIDIDKIYSVFYSVRRNRL